MRNSNYDTTNGLTPFEEDNSDFRYEIDDENPNLNKIEEDYTNDDYNFYPDFGF